MTLFDVSIRKTINNAYRYRVSIVNVRFKISSKLLFIILYYNIILIINIRRYQYNIVEKIDVSPINNNLTWLMTPDKCWHTLARSSSVQWAVRCTTPAWNFAQFTTARHTSSSSSANCKQIIHPLKYQEFPGDTWSSVK